MVMSPNFSSRGGARVRLLVVHTTENNADVTPASNVAAFFANSASQVSAHVVIDDDNTIPCVDYANAAWTVANYNSVSDNAEMVGYAAYGPADWSRHHGTIARAAQWLRDRSAARGIPLTFLSAADVAAGRSGWTSHLNLGQAGGGHHDPGQAAIDALISELEDDMPTVEQLLDAAVDYKPDGTPITLSTAIQDLAKLTGALTLDNPLGKIASAILDLPLNGPKNTLSMAAQAINTGTASVKVANVTATIDQAALNATVNAAVAAAFKTAGVIPTAADMQAACTVALKSLKWSAA